jgi:hypothetical protein
MEKQELVAGMSLPLSLGPGKGNQSLTQISDNPAGPDYRDPGSPKNILELSYCKAFRGNNTTGKVPALRKRSRPEVLE